MLETFLGGHFMRAGFERDTIIIVTEDVRKHFYLIHREVIDHMSRYEVSHFHS